MAERKGLSEIFSHWYHLIEGLQASPKDFYTAVEQAVAKRDIPDVSVFRLEWPEGGPFSPKREYLRVMRKSYTFDICGAPFGQAFFVSWWLGELSGGCLGSLIGVPIIGAIAAKFLRTTYYKIDTALMFQETVRSAVMEAVDGLTSSSGIRALSEAERKPTMHGL
jgi:hypothetical protein